MNCNSLKSDRSAIERFAWKYLLPVLGLFIPGVSSSKRSARILYRLLTDPLIAQATGLHLDYRLKQTKTSKDSRREDYQKELHKLSLKLSRTEVQ